MIIVYYTKTLSDSMSFLFSFFYRRVAEFVFMTSRPQSKKASKYKKKSLICKGES